jgi:hypothetical protein
MATMNTTITEAWFFVSGHLDLTPEEFQTHYIPKFHPAITTPGFAGFIVGDAPGCDTMFQQWIDEAYCFGGAPVVVYHMLEKPRNCLEHFRTVGGFKSDRERDEAMTAASHYDIAWVRPGREKSGTAKNLARRGKNLESIKNQLADAINDQASK